MANHFSHAGLPYPVKGARYSLLVPYLDSSGTPTDPTTPDTEVSKDAGAFADCAEEVSTITGSNGVGYITLTGAETDCVMLGLAAKVASGPKPTLATLYPRVLPVLFGGTASAGAAGSITLAGCPAVADVLVGCIVRTTGGTGGGGTGGANNQARVVTAYTSGRVATVVPNWETAPDNTTTFEVLQTDASVLTYADVKLFGGTAVTGRDIGASVLLSAGTGAGQLDFAAGVVKANVTQFGGTNATSAAGRPEVNATHWRGTALPAENVAGVPKVDVTHFRGTASAGAAGYAGVDWAAVAGQSAAVNLSATTVSAVSGNVGGVSGSVGGNVSGYIAGDVLGNVDGKVLGGGGATISGTGVQAQLPAGAIDRATFAAASGLQTIRSGTAQSGGAASVTLDASASATTDFYKGCMVYLTGGTGAGQVRLCTAYNGSTKVATVTPAWATSPGGTSTFAVLPAGLADVEAYGGTAGTFLSGRPIVESVNQAVLAASVTGDVLGNVAGDLQGKVLGGGGGTITGTGVQAQLPANGITAASVSAAAADKIADHGRRRTQAHVEASADGDALDRHSLYGLIQTSQTGSLAGTTLSVKKTDGTSLGSFTVTTDVAALPITGISG